LLERVVGQCCSEDEYWIGPRGIGSNCVMEPAVKGWRGEEGGAEGQIVGKNVIEKDSQIKGGEIRQSIRYSRIRRATGRRSVEQEKTYNTTPPAKRSKGHSKLRRKRRKNNVKSVQSPRSPHTGGACSVEGKGWRANQAIERGPGGKSEEKGNVFERLKKPPHRERLP